MADMKLCGGTLVVDEPQECLLDYVNPTSGYAFANYDTLVTNGSPLLVDGDLLAPSLLDAPVDSARFSVLHRMYPTLRDRLAALPGVALEDADDAAIRAVAGCFDLLDDRVYERQGVRGTIVSKVLHRKRPDLVPLYDSRIFAAHTAPGAIPRSSDRTWVDFMVLFCRQLRDDIRGNHAEFLALQEAAADTGATVTLLRIHDILVWMSTRAPV